MTGIIVSLPPTVEVPPGNNGSNPSSLPGITYKYAILSLPQTWTAFQTFSVGASGVTPPAGDSSLSLATTAFVTNAVSSSLLSVEQHITAAGPIDILANASVVRVDQTVGAAITLNLPLATNKTCAVLIADWKGDASTNAITINPSGSEKIQGLSSCTIAADNGSVFLRPIPGVGYVI